MAAREPSVTPALLAAYLGCVPSSEQPGTQLVQPFRLASMIRGGDRHWRTAMKMIGHEPLGMAACAVAELALAEYSKSPDAGPEVASQAILAVESLVEWQNAPDSPIGRSSVERKSIGFSVSVNVGEHLYEHSGFRARSLGRIVGKCASVVLSPENPRRVRWFGEAAEELCRIFNVPEDQLCIAISTAFHPYLQSAHR
jgi:hypothetical protein